MVRIQRSGASHFVAVKFDQLKGAARDMNRHSQFKYGLRWVADRLRMRFGDYCVAVTWDSSQKELFSYSLQAVQVFYHSRFSRSRCSAGKAMRQMVRTGTSTLPRV